MHESIRVFEKDGSLQADQVLKLFGLTFLKMHYQIETVSAGP